MQQIMLSGKQIHHWIYIAPWVLFVLIAIIFAFGFAFGWIRGGIATLYFFSINFIALIVLNLINVPFKDWLFKDVSIFHYATWVIYRIFAPLILIVGGLLIINAIAWLIYLFLLRRKIKKFESNLTPARKKASTILGAIVTGATWVYVGMMPVFSVIPITENSKKINNSFVGRTLDTLYNPLPTYTDFKIIEEYKDFFVKTYHESQTIIKQHTELKDKYIELFNYLLDQIQTNEKLFGHLDQIKNKTIAELKVTISKFVGTTEKEIKEFVDKTTAEIRKLTGLPITTDLIYGYVNGILL